MKYFYLPFLHFLLFVITEDGQFAIYINTVTDSSISLTWGAPFSSVTQYEIRYDPPVQGQDNFITIPATSLRTLTLSGLMPDSEYTITIAARSGSSFVTDESKTARTSKYKFYLQCSNFGIKAKLEWQGATATNVLRSCVIRTQL